MPENQLPAPLLNRLYFLDADALTAVQTEPVPGPPLQGPEGALAADAAAVGDPEAVQLQGDDAATAGGGLLTGSTLHGELVPSPSFIKRWMTVGYLRMLRWGLQGSGSRGLEAGWVLTSHERWQSC